MVGETNTMKREGQWISLLPRFIPVGLAGLLSFGSKILNGRVLMKEFKVLASLALALMLFVGSSTMAQDLVLPFINKVTFADGACEARSRREEESMRLDLGSVALPTNVIVFMKVST